MVTADLPFVSMGSGQQNADPFLAFLRRVLWSERVPTLAEGRLAATWAIDYVSKSSPGGVGGGIQLGTLTRQDKKWVAELAGTDSVDEHREQIVSAETLRDSRNTLIKTRTITYRKKARASVDITTSATPSA